MDGTSPELPTTNPSRRRGPRRVPALRERHEGAGSSTVSRVIATDPHRLFLFPNAMREMRRRAGCGSLLDLSRLLPSIPYIRLAKIERGEVFAKASELAAIAAALGIDNPAALLIDVEDPNFSVALWAELRGERLALNRAGEELAMLLAAAFRARRASDPELTLARLQGDYGLAPVIVSRIENAVKPIDRWNADTLSAIAAVLGIDSPKMIGKHVLGAWESGVLDAWLARIPGAREREARTRERVRALRTELARLPAAQGEARTGRPAMASSPSLASSAGRLQVQGVPLGDGLIEPYPNPQHVAPPPGTGPKAYALRMSRASLGAAIPAHAVLIVDPDRTPLQGGLAVLREEKGLRVLSVTTDSDGHLYGHSSNPKKDIPLDAVPTSALAMVVAILLG